MNIDVKIHIENTDEDYWVGFVTAGYTTRPFHVTPDVIVIGGSKYNWPENTNGDIITAVTKCMELYIK